MKAIRQLTWAALMVALMMAAVSCKKATYLNADQTEIKAEMTGAQGTIALHSDGTEFELTQSPDWVTANIADSTLTYTIGTNGTQAVRTGTIDIKCGDLTLSIPVTQVTVATKLSVDPEKVEFDKEGGTAEVTVDTDGAGVKVDCPEGITATYADGKLSIVAPKNDKSTIKGEITLTCDSLTAKVNVTVKGAVCARCKGTGYVTCSKCKGKGYWTTKEYISYDFTIYSQYGCKKCGGRGCMDSVEGDFYSPFHKGSGKVKCPDCGGKGC